MGKSHSGRDGLRDPSITAVGDKSAGPGKGDEHPGLVQTARATSRRGRKVHEVIPRDYGVSVPLGTVGH